MKRYLLTRWKRRWPVVPLSIGWGVLTHFIAPLMNPPRPNHPLGEILLPIFSILVVILFPFQWGGESRNEY